MRDSRITAWSNPTTVDSNTNGPTIDLWGGETPAGGNFEGTGTNGTGFEVLFSSITGTDPTFDVFYQVSDDDSTWFTGGYLGRVTDDSNPARLVGTARTPRRYVRLRIETGGTTPSATVNAHAVDHCGLFAEDVAWP